MEAQDNKINITDEETGEQIEIQNPNFFGPAIPEKDTAYCDDSCIIKVQGQNPKKVKFEYPDKPTEPHELAMWETLNQFENKAWKPTNTGLKTGFDSIDEALGGGLFPGFILIGGDSNIGKSGFLSQMAWQVSTLNKNDVYVMDFSLDDAMPDKLSRVAASHGRIVMNAVKTPLNYLKHPITLIRRKKALLDMRANVSRYTVYDSSFSTYIEDIEEEIMQRLIWFDAKHIDKKIAVFIDNFHDLNIASQPNLSDKEKYDKLAQWCADIAKQYDISVVCTGEFRKINNGKRATPDDLRESVKIKYEAKALLLCYNDVHYNSDKAEIYYLTKKNPHRQPIFEIHFAKNKFSSYKGTTFFEFYPEFAHFKECDKKTCKQYLSTIYG